jgi:hypothetical protein
MCPWIGGQLQNGGCRLLGIIIFFPGFGFPPMHPTGQVTIRSLLRTGSAGRWSIHFAGAIPGRKPIPQIYEQVVVHCKQAGYVFSSELG